MKISNVECMRVELPTRRPHRWTGTMGAKTIGSYLITRITSDNGLVGYGEATVLPTWAGDYDAYYGETTVISMHVIKEYLEPVIKGENPFEIAALLDKMDVAISGYPYSKASLDMALYDLMGKAVDHPAYDLMGGCYRRKIPIGHSIGLMETDKAVEEAQLAVGEGIRTLKIKVGIDQDRDVDVVQKVREAIGESVNLVIDANQGYATPKLAIQTIERMKKCNLLYAEQPVEGLDAMAKVAKALDLPIMADESVWSPHDAMQAIKLGAADMISIYTTKPGGLFKAMKVAAVAEAEGIPCNVNGSSETGVGNGANLNLAASARIVNQACFIPVTNVKGKEQTKIAGVDYLDDIVKQPYKYEEGCLVVPNRSGLGFEVDENKIQLYAKELSQSVTK